MKRRVLVAAAALVLLAGCDGSPGERDARPSATSGGTSDGTVATSSSASDPPTDVGPLVECPDLVVEPDPALPDAVPAGATSVRLCAAEPDEITPPVDALTTDVASVVAAVNDQPLVSRRCADRQLPTYQLAFGYPDGSTFVVAGRFTRCAELLVGSARRARAKPALDAFVRLLLEQRSTTRPPSGAAVDAADLDCRQPREDWTRSLGDPTGLTVAALCFGRWRDPGPRTRRVVIPPDDLRVLVASMATDTVSEDDAFSCPYFSPTDHWIVGANAWGDPITMTRGCRGLTLSPPGREWRPRGEARQIVERLIARAR